MRFDVRARALLQRAYEGDKRERADRRLLIRDLDSRRCRRRRRRRSRRSRRRRLASDEQRAAMARQGGGDLRSSPAARAPTRPREDWRKAKASGENAKIANARAQQPKSSLKTFLSVSIPLKVSNAVAKRVNRQNLTTRSFAHE